MRASTAPTRRSLGSILGNSFPLAIAIAAALTVPGARAQAQSTPAKQTAATAAATPAKQAATPTATAPATPEWVQRSNANAQVLIALFARFAPEGAAELGVPGLDEQIFDLKPGFIDRQTAAIKEAIATLKARQASEKDPAVRQDLEILIHTAEQNIRGTELSLKYNLPYFSVTETVFHGLRGLLDDQVAPERQAKALVRLRRYAGEEEGYSPLTELAMARIRERMAVPGLRGPLKEEVEKDLANSATFSDGIGKLFDKFQIKGYEKSYATLKTQLAAYEDFVRKEILPKARTDFRQPPELYAYGLEEVGVDMPVDELQSRAKASFRELQNQLQAMAPLVAKDKGITASNYRDVLRELKKKQIVGKDILPHYEARIRDVEALIRREKIVTLPARDMRIQLASEAESAAIPAPNMRPPRLIGNTGEKGTFVLPLRVPGGPGEKEKQFDDFTFEAASWTLTAHEGRPGHELQFSAVVEKGVSLARAIFSFNSVNIEGWGLYAESELQPYEPLEGQFIALQHRLMRAARAFLDPGLQLGTITKEEAFRVLHDDVVLSDAMATQEVERYTWRSPGQATAYFVGYNRLLEIRADAERMLGSRFDRQMFNDFVLAQGMVPPHLMRRAVMEEFVPSFEQKTSR